MSPIESLPFDEEEHETESEAVVQHPEDIANNMAMLWADKLKKGVCSWENIPDALRSTVQQLLGGE